MCAAVYTGWKCNFHRNTFHIKYTHLCNFMYFFFFNLLEILCKSKITSLCIYFMYSLSSTQKTHNISCLQNPHASHPCHSTAAGCELFKKKECCLTTFVWEKWDRPWHVFVPEDYVARTMMPAMTSVIIVLLMLFHPQKTPPCKDSGQLLE